MHGQKHTEVGLRSQGGSCVLFWVPETTRSTQTYSTGFRITIPIMGLGGLEFGI